MLGVAHFCEPPRLHNSEMRPAGFRLRAPQLADPPAATTQLTDVDMADAARSDASGELTLELKFVCRVNGQIAHETIFYDQCETANDGEGSPWPDVLFADVQEFVVQSVLPSWDIQGCWRMSFRLPGSPEHQLTGGAAWARIRRLRGEFNIYVSFDGGDDSLHSILLNVNLSLEFIWLLGRGVMSPYFLPPEGVALNSDVLGNT